MTLSSTILEYSTVEQVNDKETWQVMEKRSFVCLRGLITPGDVYSGLKNLKSKFSAENDKKRAPGDYDAVKSNYQRLCIGMTGGILSTNPRFFRVFYNPLWDKDTFGMHAIFRMMIRVRNRLMGLPETFAMDKPERNLWSACRVQHYPKGGGFLIPHSDINANKAVNDAGIERNANIVLIMTKRGIDFTEGGGFVEIDGEKVFYEDEYNVGDLVIYDDRNIHGVSDIDPMEPTSINSSEGRYAGFTTLMRFK